MTKSYYVDSAHLIVCGGEITDESAVWRDDIEALLPAAVNYGIQAGVWDQFKMEGDYDVPGSFVGNFPNIAVDKTDPDFPTLTLPKTMLPLSSDRGLRYLTSPKGHSYERMNDNLWCNWYYYKNLMKDQRFFRLHGKVVTLINMPKIENNATIGMIVSTEDYLDTDHLPVPVGQELTVINQLVALFKEQRSEPQDKVEDKTDIN